MSPLWKKKKQNPISRFVNEIRSSRHGESLVVQTGFPTSLIDLVVKNRSRFIKTKNTNKERYDYPRRLSLKKMERHRDQDSRKVNEDHTYRDQESRKLNADHTYRDQADHVDDKETDKGGCCDSEFRIEKCGNGGGFTKLVKLLFVLILGLGTTKKVAVAITLSAFVLLFVEFLLRSCVGGKGLRECVKKREVGEEDDLREEFENLVETRVRDIEIECEKDEECDETGEVLVEGENLRIRVIESESDKEDGCDQKKEVMVDGDERVIECRRKSGGGKITAKQFRKYVVKKLGGDSKNRKRKEEEKLRDAQSNCDVEVESIGKESIGNDEEGDEDGDECVEGNVVVEYECKCVSEVSPYVGRTRNWSLKSLILFVTVLAGLVGGRIMAMVLSAVWLVLVIALTGQRKLPARTGR